MQKCVMRKTASAVTFIILSKHLSELRHKGVKGKKKKRTSLELSQCNNKTSVLEFCSANLSLNFWRQRNDTSLVSGFYQKFRSSPILHLFETQERKKQLDLFASNIMQKFAPCEKYRICDSFNKCRKQNSTYSVEPKKCKIQ
jgi:hypothetical protein